MKVKTTCEVENYDEPRKPNLRVHNHWNDSDMVVLEIKDEKTTVKATDLEKAIRNCTNV